MSHGIGSITAGAILLLVSGLALAADAPANPMLGTWNLNVAKSKFEGAPAVKSYTLTITDAGGGKTHNVVQWVEGDGSKGSLEYTTDRGGKPAPVTGYANADAVVMKQTGPRSSHMSLLKNGKQVEWGRYTVSADGKTMRATEGGVDEKGAKYKWKEVWERQ
jgi:hypothetical protein